MLIVLLLFLLGLILTIKGGDFFVDASCWIARVTGIPSFIIGATIVSLATTLPELSVSVFSVLDGAVEMGVGNAVGSVICNTALILAISLIAMPGIIQKAEIREKGGILLLSGIMLLALSLNGVLTPLKALPLFAILIFFIYVNLKTVKKEAALPSACERERTSGKEIARNVAFFIIGVAGILIGARLMVDNGAQIARYFGVSEEIIGLTLVALGTSLPELVTTITAIIKKQHAMSVGNIIGANIIDLTLILSVCAFISPSGLPVTRPAILIDMPAAILFSAVAVIPPAIKGRFFRWQGFLMLALYAVYLGMLFLR